LDPEGHDAIREGDGEESSGQRRAILHWNACARLITRLEASGSFAAEGEGETSFRDDVPPY
jgi:hypothetical protein